MNHTTNELRLSVSSMRRYATCGYSYRLHQEGAPRRLSAAVWYGTLMHHIVERVYGGTTPTDAHEQVWAAECGSILTTLDQWSDLHASCLASGKPNTRTRRLACHSS